jgi:hypothetical protein
MREKAKKRINRGKQKKKKGMLLLYGKPETFT